MNPDSEEYAEDQLVLLKIKDKIVGRTLVQTMYFDQLNIVKYLYMTGSVYHILKNVPKELRKTHLMM